MAGTCPGQGDFAVTVRYAISASRAWPSHARVEPVPVAQLRPCRTGTRAPRRRRYGTAGPSRRPPAAPRCSPSPGPAPCCAAGSPPRPWSPRRPASTGTGPASTPACPAGWCAPGTTAASGPGMLDTYTCALGSLLRRVRHRLLELAPGSPPPGSSPPVVDRHASFAPAITATSCGSRSAARFTWAVRSDHPGPGDRVVPAVPGRARLPQQPHGERVDLRAAAGRPRHLGTVRQHRAGVETARDGVAHRGDRRRARVSHTGAGFGEALRRAAGRGGREPPPPASQPAVAHATAAVRTASTARVRRRPYRVPLCRPLAPDSVPPLASCRPPCSTHDNARERASRVAGDADGSGARTSVLPGEWRQFAAAGTDGTSHSLPRRTVASP
ncbi:hypothetical protein STENM223S_05344 [Streptomyces tendae]